MQALKKVFYFIIICLSGSSCDDPESWDCVQKLGKPVDYYPDIPTFHYVDVHDDIELQLHGGDSAYIRVSTHENLLDDLEFELVDGVYLKIKNTISCRWARPYFNTVVHVYGKSYWQVQKSGYGDVISADTLRHPLTVISGFTGTIRLMVNTPYLDIRMIGLTNFDLSGHTDSLRLFTRYKEDGQVEAGTLIANEVICEHNGSNRVRIHPVQRAEIINTSFGIVELVNVPLELIKDNRGKGRIIIRSN